MPALERRNKLARAAAKNPKGAQKRNFRFHFDSHLAIQSKVRICCELLLFIFAFDCSIIHTPICSLAADNVDFIKFRPIKPQSIPPASSRSSSSDFQLTIKDQAKQTKLSKSSALAFFHFFWGAYKSRRRTRISAGAPSGIELQTKKKKKRFFNVNSHEKSFVFCFHSSTAKKKLSFNLWSNNRWPTSEEIEGFNSSDSTFDFILIFPSD